MLRRVQPSMLLPERIRTAKTRSVASAGHLAVVHNTARKRFVRVRGANDGTQRTELRSFR